MMLRFCNFTARGDCPFGLNVTQKDSNASINKGQTYSNKKCTAKALHVATSTVQVDRMLLYDTFESPMLDVTPPRCHLMGKVSPTRSALLDLRNLISQANLTIYCNHYLALAITLLLPSPSSQAIPLP